LRKLPSKNARRWWNLRNTGSASQGDCIQAGVRSDFLGL
jgi:hypothetical protein